MSILTVEGLEKTFGGLKALSGVSFSVKKGEILGVIGPNGSGKTTLINCITGFVRPDEGKVLFKGGDITRWRAHRIARVGIARTFQVMRPFYSLPAYKNLIIPLWSPRARKEGGWRGGGKHGDRDTVAIDILEEIGFERDSRVPYKLASTLPTGYLKRLELARCLALRPEVIFCDEVFSGLSASEVASMLPLIEKLKMGGITLVLIEHRLRELFKVADRVMALQFGEKIAEGHYKDVIEDPRVKEAYLGIEEIYVLEASGLMVYYENMLALNNVGLKAEEGSVIGVFGSNSAGKSTLMYMLSGILLDIRKKEEMRGGERITLLGKITLDGEEITSLPPHERAARGIVLCPERRRIFGESSVIENLRIGSYLAPRKDRAGDIEYVFRIFPRLKDHIHRQGGFLSGGEQQMLAIGRALMAHPKILLLDEPLLGLSPAYQKIVIDSIREIRAARGITIVIAEQYARPVIPVIDRGYIIENGSAILEGTKEELMGNPDVKSAYFGV